MSEETQEHPFLTAEQQQRTYAAQAAGNILRGQSAGSGPLTPRGSEPAKFEHIVELADYIVTGDVYMINLARREKAEFPLVMGSFGLSGLFTDLLADIAREENQKSPGDSEDSQPTLDFD